MVENTLLMSEVGRMGRLVRDHKKATVSPVCWLPPVQVCRIASLNACSIPNNVASESIKVARHRSKC